MSTKTKLLKEIDQSTKEFSNEDLVEKLMFIEKVETGLGQSEQGDVISEAELECYINQLFVGKL